MLKVDGLQKNYYDFSLNCSIQVNSGNITGLVGKNGSGKSTIFKAILGLIGLDKGQIKLFNKTISDLSIEDKQNLGVVFSDSGFNQNLTLLDLIPILDNLFTNFDKAFFLEKAQLLELPSNKKIGNFSTGMKAKLKILVALSHQAKFLILDEPTNGLDVIARNEILEMLRDFMEEDETRAILISSHNLEDLKSLCDDLYIINEGEMILYEDMDTILSDYAVIKLSYEQFKEIDKSYLLNLKEESFGYSCLTNQRQYYIDNYPNFVIESGQVDEIVSILVKGKEL